LGRPYTIFLVSRFFFVMMSVVFVAPMTAMHEMHQWAGQQQKIRQRTEDVRAVLGEEQNPSNREEADHD
jgi:hypothetical protein